MHLRFTVKNGYSPDLHSDLLDYSYAIGILLPASSLAKANSSGLSQEEKTLGQYIPLLYHYNMLQDVDRVGGFQEAIRYRVRPGMHVVELGTGTGILSSFAARAGATVDAVERNPELVLKARALVEANGLADQITVQSADASTWVPSQPVDVVICEMLHVALVREKQTAVIDAFKRNYVRRFGPKLPVFIPEASVLLVQPVQQNFNYHGYVAPVPMFHSANSVQPRTTEIAALQPYAMVFYDEEIPQRFSHHGQFTASVDGEINALRFVTQNALAVDLQAQRSIDWPNQCMVLPLDSPLRIQAGETLSVTLDYHAGCAVEDIHYKVTLGPALRLVS